MLRKPVLFLIIATLTFAGAAFGAPDHDSGQALVGKQLFRSYCATCHGEGAKGDGSLAEVLTTRPANLTLLAAQNGGEFPAERTRKVIDGREKVRGHGTADMPAWGDAFLAISSSEAEVAEKIEQLVQYLMSIQEDADEVASVPTIASPSAFEPAPAK